MKPLADTSENTFSDVAPHSLLFVALAATMAGFLDSLYLTLSHFNSTSVVCSILNGCDIVLTSSFSTIAGMPTALGGILYYGVLAALLLYILLRSSRTALFGALVLSWFALGVSVMLLYVQAAVLHAYCLYCVISAGLTLLISMLLLALSIKRARRRHLKSII